MQLECDECGFQTEDPPSLHIHQAETHRKEKLISRSDIGTVTPTTDHTRKVDRTTQLRSKSMEATSHMRDENIPTDSNKGITRQRLGTLNFPLLNPKNAIRGHQDKHGEQSVKTTTEALKLTPNCDRPQTTPAETTPATISPTETVVLEVEDILVDVRDEEHHDTRQTQRDTASKRGRSPHQDAERHHSPTEPKKDTQDETFCETFCETCYRTFESPQANDNHEPRKAASYYVPQRTNEQMHLTGSPMAAKVMKCDTRFPPETPIDKTNHNTHNIPAEIRATANAEIATICRTILQGKPDVDGSYNVNGQVMSLQELHRQIGNLQDQN